MKALLFLALAFCQTANAAAYRDAVSVEGTTISVAEVARDHIAGEGLLSIMMQAASEPVFAEDGSIDGFMLSLIDPGSVYETVGLQNFDIVTHIDGVALNGADVAIRMLKAVKHQDFFTFEVLRRGEAKPIRYEVRVK